MEEMTEEPGEFATTPPAEEVTEEMTEEQGEHDGDVGGPAAPASRKRRRHDPPHPAARSAAAGAPTPSDAASAEARPPDVAMPIDIQLAVSGMSPKLHVWQVPEIVAAITCIEDFLASPVARRRKGRATHARHVATIFVLLRGTRGLHGIEETVDAYHRGQQGITRSW